VSAVTVSVGDRSRSLAGGLVLVACLAAAGILVALGLVAGRVTATAAPATAPVPTSVQQAGPDQLPGAGNACRVRVPC
jgi:hypothetical protein